MSFKPSTMEVHSAVDSRDFFVVLDRPHPDFLAEPGVMEAGVDACKVHTLRIGPVQ